MFIKEFIKNLLKKISSAKLWITLWAMFELHCIIQTGRELGAVAVLLTAVPLSFMGLNVLQDFIFKGK
jgi:hypothetical protein